VLGAHDAQPFAVGAIDGIVEIAKHIVAFDFGLKNGAKRRLAFELVETAFHVTDGVAHRQSVATRGAIHRGRFRLAIVIIRIFIRTTVD